MPVVDLLDRIDSRELTEWGLFFALKNEEATPEADRVIAHGLDDRRTDDNDDEDDDAASDDAPEHDPSDPFDV